MLDFSQMVSPDPQADVPAFSVPIRVRYAETDAAGVVYYAQYFVYFEVARVEALRHLGVPITEVEARGVLMPVVEARVKYLRPAHLDDLLDVSLGVAGIGPASFAFDYEVRREGLLLVTGWTRLATVERDSGRAMPLPGWVHELFRDLGVAGAAS
jgi:acyl-CoA thioester hydrolase